jgi:hypothetical protein
MLLPDFALQREFARVQNRPSSTLIWLYLTLSLLCASWLLLRPRTHTPSALARSSKFCCLFLCKTALNFSKYLKARVRTCVQMLPCLNFMWQQSEKYHAKLPLGNLIACSNAACSTLLIFFYNWKSITRAAKRSNPVQNLSQYKRKGLCSYAFCICIALCDPTTSTAGLV